ncbi:MAG TPA: DUF6485 family protein [Candidatus Omnitrophota bacterium]|nr:DUF6485 family protein [Candidatus Omnitrophota bacterium]
MENCPNIRKNSLNCNCTYVGCPRHGLCCECIAYHRRSGELPACYFDEASERTYDRSIGNYRQTR